MAACDCQNGSSCAKAVCIRDQNGSLWPTKDGCVIVDRAAEPLTLKVEDNSPFQLVVEDPVNAPNCVTLRWAARWDQDTSTLYAKDGTTVLLQVSPDLGLSGFNGIQVLNGSQIGLKIDPENPPFFINKDNCVSTNPL